MKGKITGIGMLVLCLSMLAYGSIAFFTAEETAHNVITTYGVDIALQEWADEEKTTAFPAEGIRGVMPGKTVTKIAEVKNTGNSAAYLRVKTAEKVVLTDGEEGSTEFVTIDFNQTDWTYRDGFYYYNKALSPGETTAPLFTGVTFDKGMDNRYQNSRVSVDVTAYAVQAANNGGSAVEAAGWPETR